LQQAVESLGSTEVVPPKYCQAPTTEEHNKIGATLADVVVAAAVVAAVVVVVAAVVVAAVVLAAVVVAAVVVAGLSLSRMPPLPLQ